MELTDESVLPRPGREPGPVSVFVLVGFMGAGKTSVGETIAKRLDWRFEDLDHLIEKREGRSVHQIFEQDGEPRFRELEQQVLGETLAASDSVSLVLALGGGAFASEGVRALLKGHGVPAVWLDAPVEELFRRCEQPGVVRPLRRDPEQFAKLYEQRLSYYRRADVGVITKGEDISSVAEEVIERLALQPRSRSSE